MGRGRGIDDAETDCLQDGVGGLDGGVRGAEVGPRDQVKMSGRVLNLREGGHSDCSRPESNRLETRLGLVEQPMYHRSHGEV